jgi:hypothetical protein
MLREVLIPVEGFLAAVGFDGKRDPARGMNTAKAILALRAFFLLGFRGRVQGLFQHAPQH